MLKHYVEIFYPSSPFYKSEVKEIEERNPELIDIPDDAFGYRFFDSTEVITDGKMSTGEKKNISCMTYFGTAYTLDEIKEKFPQEKTLISNMELYKWKYLVKTRCGNWKVMEKGDQAI